MKNEEKEKITEKSFRDIPLMIFSRMNMILKSWKEQY